MAKGRMLNRKIATDEGFNQLTIRTQWLYMRMLPFMDDYGRLTGNLFELKYQIIPSVDINSRKIELCLQEMIKYNLIYFKKDTVIQFRGFNKNQKIGHKKATSLYPDITGDVDIANNSLSLLSKGSNNIIKDNIIKNNINKPNSYRAKPKDLEMVINFFKEKKIPDYIDNATKFYNHYEASGWMRGKTKIKNWKMCISAWDFEKSETKTKTDKDLWRRNPNGYIVGYCDKCGKSGMGNNIYDLRNTASCCGVEYVPTKPSK